MRSLIRLAHRRSYLPPLLLTLALLSGCATTLGTAPAQTFNQKVAYAVGIHTAVLQAATNGVTNHTLSSADGEAVLKMADSSRALIDAAVLLNGTGDIAGANSKLTLAVTALTALQTYLNAHAGSTP